MSDDVYDADADAYGMLVTCPRCDRRTEAKKIWIWVVDSGSASLRQVEQQSSDTLAGARSRRGQGQAEPLRLVRGEIRQSGAAELFDLACGCAFDTRMWKLRVRSTVSIRTGGSMSIHVEPRFAPQLEQGQG